MHWNFRIVKHKHKHGDYYAIHEVFYNDKNKPRSCTKDPVDITSEEIKGIRWCLNKMRLALKKPVLDYDYFEKKGKKGKRK